MSPPVRLGGPGPAASHERLLILDYGSQYTQLIARRARELGVYAEIRPGTDGGSGIRDFAPRAIILSGGPASVLEPGAPTVPAAVWSAGVPVLGICYGMQAMAQALGGKLEDSWPHEYGAAELRLEKTPSRLFARLEASEGRALQVWMSHGVRITGLPPGFRVLAGNRATPVAAMADEARGLYGLQFHPEVRHTPEGSRLLASFLHDIAGFRGDWRIEDFETEILRALGERLPEGRVLLALSGGVDSAVTAALLARALPGRVVAVVVDTGLLREGELGGIREAFRSMPIDLRVVDASRRFLEALDGVRDPEDKRHIIGRLFIEVFAEEARALADIRALAQGTIYPDVIESAGGAGPAQVIKSHHNVGGLPESLPFEIVEPLRWLFKDEVRALGHRLGLPPALITRQPFPGPGLAVRILGPVTAAGVDLLRRADHLFLDELTRSGWLERTSQAFAVLLPVRSVAVKGDGRAYEPVVALRAVVTDDFMTAHWAELPHELLARISLRLTNEVPGLSRVVYDITGKPPATIEWE